MDWEVVWTEPALGGLVQPLLPFNFISLLRQTPIAIHLLPGGSDGTPTS
jgi:hypothetical protein